MGILAAGITPDELIDQFGSYAHMCMQLFSNNGHVFEYQVYNVRDGDFPETMNDCHAWVITGSKCSVYQYLPWMKTLSAFIKTAHASQKKMLGICFGHQIIAQALGGHVDKGLDTLHAKDAKADSPKVAHWLAAFIKGRA